jgi:hypothetical protein
MAYYTRKRSGKTTRLLMGGSDVVCALRFELGAVIEIGNCQTTKHQVLSTNLVMTLNFGDAWERDFYDLSIRTKHLDAGCCEGLRCLHAAYGTSYPTTVSGDDLHVLFAVKRLQCCQSFSNFHVSTFHQVVRSGCAEILPVGAAIVQ